ncbi:Alpha/Beta hydrolase protein [Xylogone sp. PMI_703]|nr:Alpha/Beta hydrolase protein [Xylogone sp. PMI_703]
MPFKVGSFEVLQHPATPVDAPGSRYAGLHPSTTILPKGHKKAPDNRPLSANTIWDRDIQLRLRDGIQLRADVFRPEGNERVPALIPWSPYGKSGTGFLDLHVVPGRVGIPQSMLSGYEKFEAPDPAEWVGRGYAIVNIDARGVFDSESDIRWLGTAEGQDGYDAIEEVAKLPWCNGKVALVGNSWLAMATWHIAAERPPHLACIAPFEGVSDLYRESLCRGGVPYTPFWGFLSTKLFGRNKQESVIPMLEKYPYMNEYWEDKRAKIEDIDVPAYVLASYSTGLHTIGSFRGFTDIQHKNKWLRVHGTQEWHDLYQKESIDDLQLFLDRYTKGVDNGWEKTPSVRVSMLQFNKDPIPNQVFPDWPVPNTKYTTFYLDSSNTLSEAKPESESTLSYQSDAPALQVDADGEELKFSYTFTKKSYLVGYPKAILSMSTPDHNDLDVFVQLRKASPTGEILRNCNIPLKDLGVSSAEEVTPVNTNFYLGPNGVLRASRRAIDEERSKPYWALHKHTKETEALVSPGEVVEMDIGMWPSAIVFEPGEKLVLKVAGHSMVLAEFEPLRGRFVTGNKGRHTLHMGGRFESRVVIPLVEL